MEVLPPVPIARAPTRASQSKKGRYTMPTPRARALAVAPPPSSRITWEGIEWLHPSAQAGRPEAGAGRRHPPGAWRRRNDPRTTPEPRCGSGDEMLMAFESAKFDEDTFTDPTEYDLGRRFW
jgi:hypothetical protein